MTSLSETLITDSFLVRVGDTIDRDQFEVALQNARKEGRLFRVFDPRHRAATMDHVPERINIFLDLKGKVLSITKG